MQSTSGSNVEVSPQRGRGKFSKTPQLIAAIKSQRKRYGLTQAAFADKCNILPNIINRYEAGENIPSLKNFAKLARGLGMKPWELMKQIEEENGIQEKEPTEEKGTQ